MIERSLFHSINLSFISGSQGVHSCKRMPILNISGQRKGSVDVAKSYPNRGGM